MKSGEWSAKEVELLTNLARENKKDAEIAEAIGRTMKSVASKRRSLGISGYVKGATDQGERKRVRDRSPQRAAMLFMVRSAIRRGEQSNIIAATVSEATGYSMSTVYETIARERKAAEREAMTGKAKAGMFAPREVDGMVEMAPGHFADRRSAKLILSAWGVR
ncbi:MAG: hypothetical protein N2444_00180 [Methylocystis sp.]|nr:hypothetical protein [Methylocystis sp.]